MRIVKDAKERRKEILDVAERLFCQNGYDITSTNDILNEIGIARGTLYYHFKSKEDILDAIIQRILKEIVRKVKSIATDSSLTVLEKFTKAVLNANVDTKLGDIVLEQVHKPQNALMHQKMQKVLLDSISPYFVIIIKEGIDQGIFYTEYPEETIEMTLTYANQAFDDQILYSEEEKQKKVQGFIYNVELMLHVDQNSLYETMLPMFYRE